MIEVYAVNINSDFEKYKFNKLLLRLSSEKQKRISQFLNSKDAERAIISDILIRNVITSKFGIRNDKIIFNKNKWGKPFLENFNQFHFNISHSGDWVVCAIGNFEVGIDVEKIQYIDLDIPKRFFAKEEYDFLLNQDEYNRVGYFYDLWTLKESYVKAVGKGLYIPLNSFSVNIKKNEIKLSTTSECNYFYFKQYDIDTNYKISVCGYKDQFFKAINIKGLEKMYEEIMSVKY